jgi:hypothetical protein
LIFLEIGESITVQVAGRFILSGIQRVLHFPPVGHPVPVGVRIRWFGQRLGLLHPITESIRVEIPIEEGRSSGHIFIGTEIAGVFGVIDAILEFDVVDNSDGIADSDRRR